MLLILSLAGVLSLAIILSMVSISTFKRMRNTKCLDQYGMTYKEYHFRKKHNMFINKDHKKLQNLSKEEMSKYNELVDSFIDGFIDEKEFDERKKVILDKMKN